MTTKGKLKIVSWVDSHATPKWGPPDNVSPVPAECVTVGFIIHDTKAAITLAQTVRTDDGYGDVCGCMTIPRGCIKSIKALK